MSYRPLIFRAAPFVATIGLAYAGGYLYKDWTIPRFESDESLEGKTVVITGATKGLGRATAKEFAKRNARVILGCKDQDKCIGVRRKIVDSTSNSEVYCSVLDMSSIKSIQEFIRRLDDKKIGVDILINNAAVKSVTLRSTREGFEKQLGVNYLGHFYLTYALMDNLLKNAPSRIVNVVCPNYRKGKINFEDLNSKNSFDYDKAYNQSKLAMALFTKELADRLKKTNVFVYSADPGLCRTDLNREMRYRKSMIAKIFVSPILWFFERSPFHGSQVILHCALSPDLANQEAAGLYYKNNQPQTTEEILDDKALAKKLWLVSEKWTVHRVKPLPPTSAQDSPNKDSQSKDSASSQKDEKNS